MNRREALKTSSAAAMALSTKCFWPPAAPGIRQNVIPSSGEKLPCVGLGTWLTFDVRSDDRGALDERNAVVSNLMQAGGAMIDSSPMYGRSEQTVGTVINHLRASKKLFLATKVWTHGQHQGQTQIAASSEKMSKKVLDLIQIHNLMDWKTHMKTLQAMKESGQVRYIGITHYLSHAYSQMERILRNYPIDFIQVNYNVGAQQSGDRLLPAARDHGKAVVINRPFAGGSVFRQVRNKSLPDVAKDLGCQNWAELLLKFVVSNPAVTCAIPGTRQPVHMLEKRNCREYRAPRTSASGSQSQRPL